MHHVCGVVSAYLRQGCSSSARSPPSHQLAISRMMSSNKNAKAQAAHSASYPLRHPKHLVGIFVIIVLTVSVNFHKPNILGNFDGVLLSPRPSDVMTAVPGYAFAGTCETLSDPQFGNTSTFHLGAFVKHGVNAFGFARHACKDNHRIFFQNGALKLDGVPSFMSVPTDYKVLPVRGQASWHKSAYNHLCNKVAQAGWRTRRRIDCETMDMSLYFQMLDEQEVKVNVDPNRVRASVVSHRPKHIVFYDYLILEKLIEPLCKNLKIRTSSAEINSAAGQGYIDYFSQWKVAPWTKSDFWDKMYDDLRRTNGCLHYVVSDEGATLETNFNFDSKGQARKRRRHWRNATIMGGRIND